MQQYGSEVDKEAYKQKRKEAKKVVASIKAEEYKKWEENKGNADDENRSIQDS